MTQTKLLQEITLADGTKAYVLSPEQMIALAEIAEDRIWLRATQARLKRVSLFAAGAIGFLTLISVWWPWIKNIVEFLIRDLPK